MNKAYSLICLSIVCSLCVSCSIDPLFDTAQLNELPVESVLLKENLRVLDIGNSYTNDATSCLSYIVEQLGADVSDFCLFKAIRGGASFRHWYNIYMDKDSDKYEVVRVVGGLPVSIQEGVAEPHDGSLFRSLLRDEHWDIILIHQLGRYSTCYDELFSRGDAGYLKELLSIIKKYQPHCLIGYLFTHTSSGSYPTNYEHSSFKRWEKAMAVVSKLEKEVGITPVVPYGTAIQNLRASSLNDCNDLTRDGAHLGLGLARYTAACCYYERILAPRTGITILGKELEYRVKDDPETSQISVTRDIMITAQKSAVLACRYPYLCLNPDDFSSNLEVF